MDEATNKDPLSELMRVLEDHRDDLKRHRKTLREFRSQFFGCEDTQSPCYVMVRQDQLDDLKNLTNKFKTTANSLCQCLNSIEETKLVVTGVPEEEDQEVHWGYEEKLSKSVTQWKTGAKNKRQNGNNKSLVEWYCDKELDREEEEKERKTLSIVRFLGIDLGSEISGLLVEYFTSLVRSKNKEEVERKIELVKSRIRSVSLVGDDNNESIVVERFVRVMESIERELITIVINYNSSNSRKRKKTSVDVLEKRSENDVLGAIFNSVINLEVAFSYPFFQNKIEKEASLSLLKKIRDSLGSKLKESSLEIRALKKELFNSEKEEDQEEEEDQDPELKKVKLMLDWESEEIWNGLDLKLMRD